MEKKENDKHYGNIGITLQMDTLTFEAESVSYAVCQYFGIETGANSFGYISGWSSGKELKELKESLDVIKNTSAQLIDSIEAKFKELLEERNTPQNEKTEEITETAQEETEITNISDNESIEMPPENQEERSETENDIKTENQEEHTETNINTENQEQSAEIKADVAVENQEEHAENEAYIKAENSDYIMPDNNITIQELNEYGYSYENMLPLTQSRALELFDSDNAIYLIYPDNTE